MKRMATLILLLGMMLFTITGCITNTSGVTLEKGRVIIEDPAFASNIQMILDVREKTNEGFLHAQVSLKNLNRTDYQCQYCFEWRDRNGLIMQHVPTSWRPLVMHGRETVEIDSVSPIQGTEDFRLKLRRMD